MQRLKTGLAWAILALATAFTLAFIGFLVYSMFWAVIDSLGTPETTLIFQIIGGGVVLYGMYRALDWAIKEVDRV